ncbi:MAG TPA: zinc ribbon domain-containing protein [Blastocatellia bacterium]|nr:zinc ribbon domain-containing protein [Blastocatellia bacterium]
MYCPNCSTQGVDGAKFCKACGMNLSIITQALNGGVSGPDPHRDREYKRARKQISDGIHGSAIGLALLVAAALAYVLIPGNVYVVVSTLVLALFGVIKLFRSIGGIIDAKVGQKLLDPASHPRGTGNLSAAAPVTSALQVVRSSQRLAMDPARPAGNTRPVNPDAGANPPAPPSVMPPNAPPPPLAGRVNREHSSPLKKLERESEIFTNLRN